MHTLTSIPLEVLQNIALKTVDGEQDAGPPSSIPQLQLTCSSLNRAFKFADHPSFYATLFDTLFDAPALRRRFPAERLTAVNRAAELKRRWKLLKQIKDVVALSTPENGLHIWGDPVNNVQGAYSSEDKLEHAWLVYLMLTESDGNNWLQLKWAEITLWVYTFIHFDIDRISTHAQETGMLPPSNDFRALGMWIYWMTTRYDDVLTESTTALGQVNRMLRPFAFASFGYSFFYAPWTSRQLPDAGIHINVPSTLNGPLFSDTRPTNRTTTLPSYFNSPLAISPPHLSHAAALLFFTRMQRFPLGQLESRPTDYNALNRFRAKWGDEAAYTPKHCCVRYPEVEESEEYDEDVMKMVWCRDPTKGTLEGKRPRWSYRPGTFVGEWEGRLVNYGLGAFQLIGEGHPPLDALEQEPLRQDPQAWRLHEFHHPSSLRGHLKRQYHQFLRRTYPSSQHHHHSKPWAPPSHARSPIKHTGVMQELFNAFLPPGTKRELVYGGAELVSPKTGQTAPVFYVEVKRCVRSGRTYVGEYEEVDWSVDDDWESEDEGECDEDTKSDEIEIVVEGAAIQRVHVYPYESVSMLETNSIIYGTIRRYDGLINLHAVPINENSGTWLYRGYVSSNGNFIGRTRDTWTTDVWREGYEGVFVMTRR